MFCLNPISQGETAEEALDNIKDAFKAYLSSVEDLNRLKKLGTITTLLI